MYPKFYCYYNETGGVNPIWCRGPAAVLLFNLPTVVDPALDLCFCHNGSAGDILNNWRLTYCHSPDILCLLDVFPETDRIIALLPL